MSSSDRLTLKPGETKTKLPYLPGYKHVNHLEPVTKHISFSDPRKKSENMSSSDRLTLKPGKNI